MATDGSGYTPTIFLKAEHIELNKKQTLRIFQVWGNGKKVLRYTFKNSVIWLRFSVIVNKKIHWTTWFKATYIQ